MQKWRNCFVIVMLAVALSAGLLLSGCEGTDTRNQVDDTVEELAGKKQVDNMKAMKEELEHIQNQRADRIKQLDETQ